MNRRIKKKSWTPKKKVIGSCPLCGSKMIWGSWCYADTPKDIRELPICTNLENCDLSIGYGSDIAWKNVNHRTVKITGMWD